MSKKMLIDASRSDETRVVVMVDGRIEEIDHETADRRPIKSNIYLARVTRVEPSLQAAFVDYGGNRHGFLPFSEIHPDYYQLPVADREALLQEVEDKVEERRQRFLNRQKGPRRSSAAGNTEATSVDPDGEQPHVEFPVDENGDFIQPEALTAADVEVEAVADDADAAEEEAPVALAADEATEAEVAEAVADTDAVAATLGLDETLTEQAIVENADEDATVTLTEAKDGDADKNSDDDEPAKTVTAATGTEEEEAVSEDVADSGDEEEGESEDAAVEETAEEEDDADASDDDQVDEEQLAAEGEEDSGSAETDAEGGVEEVDVEDVVIEEAGSGSDDDDDDDDEDDDSESGDSEEEAAAKKSSRSRRRRRSRGRRKSEKDDSEATVSASDADDDADDDDIEEEEDEDIFDEDAERRAIMHSIISRRYKIQEVIKRRQVMLVQVTKEERGNKGAALSSYLSLAGRYCVYMPNTTRGGGISRKISSPKDRRRLKTILDELNLPQDISIIVRTAGSQRTKAEIKRDYEYLRRTWDGIRENTLTSMAPSLIYEEANVMKRAIRDMYSSDMEEVLVEGEEGYKSAKNFMKVLTPSHAKRVQHHKNEGVSLFQRHKAEQQLDSLFNPVVTLKSGGYLVMNQTEALVAVDVNSGKATKERSIEETALATNLEAAEEVARQLRLRDLAGLVVIDFIDMDESKHRGQVERKLKESMRGDRARIQLGRISPFGLLELSRQRIRPSVFETTMVGCSVCGGIGVVRSSASLASSIMRRVGDLLLERDNLDRIEIDALTDAALKLLNDHREELANLEAQYSVRISILPNSHLFSPHFHMRVYTDEKMETFEEGYTSDPTAPKKSDRRRGRKKDSKSERSDDEDSGRKTKRGRGRGARAEVEEEDQSASETTEADAATEDGDGESKPRRQRGKRGGRRRNKKDADAAVGADEEALDAAGEGEADAAEGGDAAEADAAEGEGDKPKRRRGKRGGRNRRKTKAEGEAEAESENATEATEAADGEEARAEAPAAEETTAEEAPAEAVAADEPAAEEEPAEKPKPRRSRAKKPKPEPEVEAAAEPEAPAEEAAAPAEEAPVEAAEPEAEAAEEDAGAASTSHAAVEPDTPKKDGPRKRGWWSRGR